MTEQHLKALSNLTSDIRLAYDGDEAGVRATERAIMMAGDLGLDLTVISDYHGAKDPDELIQKDPKLWQQAVKNSIPAVDWLLSKYEENLDLKKSPDKRKYSDIALKLLSYVKDEVERASYEEKVARKIGVEVSILREKGDRLHQKLTQSTKRFLKKPKTEVKSDKLKKLEDSLLALKIFGGITKTKIPLDIPEDETKLAELELVFNSEHEKTKSQNYEEEATELLTLYNKELNKHIIANLNEQLKTLDESSSEYEDILRQITDLQKTPI